MSMRVGRKMKALPWGVGMTRRRSWRWWPLVRAMMAGVAGAIVGVLISTLPGVWGWLALSLIVVATVAYCVHTLLWIRRVKARQRELMMCARLLIEYSRRHIKDRDA